VSLVAVMTVVARRAGAAATKWPSSGSVLTPGRVA